MKYHIDTDLGIMYQDEGPWRSYELVTSGSTKEELLEDATISEVDQDGGELACYSFDDAGNQVSEAVLREIESAMKENK